MSTAPLASPEILHELVIANRILAHEGVVDAFGHVSIRHPDQPAHYLIARSLGPEWVTADDLQRFTLAGEQVGGDPRPAYSERAIHGAIYETRPEVAAVCHHHAPSTIPFGVTGLPLRPIFHMAGLLGTEVPIWDPADEFGDTDMLVRTLEQGRSLARTLGGRSAALMRGHGAVVVGRSLREVVIAAVYMEQNARLQLQAEATGRPVRYLSDREIERTWEWFPNPSISERAWGCWAARVADNE